MIWCVELLMKRCRCLFFQEGFEFKKPTKPASRCRMRSFNSALTKDAFASRPSSAPALMVCKCEASVSSWCRKCKAGFNGDTLSLFPVQLSSPSPVQQLEFHDSPLFLRRSSLTSSLNDDEDDGFLDVLDDNMEVRPCLLHCHAWKYWLNGLYCKFCLSEITVSLRDIQGIKLSIKEQLLLSALSLSDKTHCHPQSDSSMPMGMASLLTAPLVADSTGEDSVSLSVVAKMFLCDLLKFNSLRLVSFQKKAESL